MTSSRGRSDAARLKDPDDHFPYRRDAALAVLEDGPAEGTNDHPAQWYLSTAVVDASAAMVEAQEAYIKNPGDATKEAYDTAQNELVEARRTHRQGRPVSPVAVAGNVDDIERRQTAMRTLAKAGFSAEQIAETTNRPVAEVQGAISGLED